MLIYNYFIRNKTIKTDYGRVVQFSQKKLKKDILKKYQKLYKLPFLDESKNYRISLVIKEDVICSLCGYDYRIDVDDKKICPDCSNED